MKDDALVYLDNLAFKNEYVVKDFIECKVDIEKPENLSPVQLCLTEQIMFTDRTLPESSYSFTENNVFNKQYFVDLHENVKRYGVHNYRGARIPLKHNNIKVGPFRAHLNRFSYPDIHVLQFVEYGFPLGLWSNAYLEPCVRNHSSSYSYYTYVDKFVSSEISKCGITGPFKKSPWESIMISPMMTSHKKPNSRRTVFDASFGMYSLNKNTPENCYHEMEYEFHFPKIDDLADRVAELGQNCFLWKRDLSRFFLQLKVDPLEYDKLGFIWREQLFLFVSFVWGCRHAGYCGQWLTSAVAFICQSLGLEKCGEKFFILNYADDFGGAEADLSRAMLSFETMGDLLAEIGLTEAVDKANPPSKIMTYLGVGFDTTRMCLFVDSEKLEEIKYLIEKWVRKTVAKKAELQSILGKLLWISKTVRHSRVFVCRIIAEIRKLSKQTEKTTLSLDIKKDFLWWKTFIEVFNGVELIPSPSISLSVFGDACLQSGGSWNPTCSEYFSLNFPHYMWSAETPIHVKEFLIVIICMRLWGPSWAGKKVLIYCDNDAVCDTIVHQKPKNQTMQQLLRECLFWVCRFNFTPIVEKIATKDNYVADFLSRNTNSDDINTYFESLGLYPQIKKEIPLDWFKFQADW